MERSLQSGLQHYLTDHVLPAMEAIPSDRREILERIAAFVKNGAVDGTRTELLFICTHNSRRSHLSQIWASTAAWYFALDHVRTFSGGTEATAFNPRAVAAIERAGFQVKRPDGPDPKYEVSFTTERNADLCWSKVYNDPPNPQHGFCAVMTCSEADAGCPFVAGARQRISLPFEDPKEADGTPEEAQRYDERCLQIAAEMMYVMRQAGR